MDYTHILVLFAGYLALYGIVVAMLC